MTKEYTRGHVLNVVKSRGPVDWRELCIGVFPRPETDADKDELQSTLKQLEDDGEIVREDVTLRRSLVTVWREVRKAKP
jgi:hypothetical protein